MKKERRLRPRAADPLWLLACGLWGKLLPDERRLVVDIMSHFIGGSEENLVGAPRGQQEAESVPLSSIIPQNAENGQ